LLHFINDQQHIDLDFGHQRLKYLRQRSAVAGPTAVNLKAEAHAHGPQVEAFDALPKTEPRRLKLGQGVADSVAYQGVGLLR
jgi:hypothetical protein